MTRDTAGDKYQDNWQQEIYLMITVVIILAIILIITVAYFLDKLGWIYGGQKTTVERYHESSSNSPYFSPSHSPKIQHSGGARLAHNQEEKTLAQAIKDAYKKFKANNQVANCCVQPTPKSNEKARPSVEDRQQEYRVYGRDIVPDTERDLVAQTNGPMMTEEQVDRVGPAETQQTWRNLSFANGNQDLEIKN